MDVDRRNRRFKSLHNDSDYLARVDEVDSDMLIEQAWYEDHTDQPLFQVEIVVTNMATTDDRPADRHSRRRFAVRVAARSAPAVAMGRI